MSQLQSEPRVRVFSEGRVLIRFCSHREAVRGVRQKQLRLLRVNRNRIKAVVDPSARVDAQIPGAALRTVKKEHLADTYSVHVLLRVQLYGTPEHPAEGTVPWQTRDWDPHLTFKELRAGKFVSAETMRIRAVKREKEREDNALRYTGKGSSRR